MKPLLICVTAALALASSASAAVDPAEWSSAVDAMHAVDSTLQAPPFDPAAASAVGGGSVVAPPDNNGFIFPKFGFGVRTDATGIRGEMVLDQGFGTVLRATPICLAAAPLGSGGIATLVGQVVEEGALAPRIMIFHVTDGGLTGAQGDAWDAQFIPLPLSPPTTLESLCVPSGSANPIVGSIVINVP